MSRAARNRRPPGKFDGRSHAGRAAKQLRIALTEHLGGNPSAVQLLLISQACSLSARIATMDESFRKAGHMSDHHTREYLAFSNSLCRLTERLGLKGAKSKPPTLADHIAKRKTAPAEAEAA